MGKVGNAGLGHTTLNTSGVKAELKDCPEKGLGMYLSGNGLGHILKGRNDFRGLPWTGSLHSQIGMGVETSSGTNRRVCLSGTHGRCGLG